MDVGLDIGLDGGTFGGRGALCTALEDLGDVLWTWQLDRIWMFVCLHHLDTLPGPILPPNSCSVALA